MLELLESGERPQFNSHFCRINVLSMQQIDKWNQIK